MTTTKIDLNSTARESATIYVEAIIEACEQAKVKADPKIMLTDADDYPQILKISEVEYAIGWLNGCAETCGVLVELLWDEVAPKVEPAATKLERARGRRAGGAR